MKKGIAPTLTAEQQLENASSVTTMTKEKFWQLIEKAKLVPNDNIETCDSLINELAQLEDTDIFKWDQLLYQYLSAAYKNKLWAAGHIINGWCSDDGFEYFRCGLIALGHDTYLKALAEPDDLADVLTEHRRIRLELLLCAASDAYEKKHNIEDFDVFLDKMELAPSLSNEEICVIEAEIVYAPDIDIDLSKGNNLKKLLPKLCKRFNWSGQKIYIES